MMVRRALLKASVAIFGTMLVAGCEQYPKYVYRFKLTIEVETPQGLRSGYSIYEITANQRQKILPEEAARAWSTRGEAVTVGIAPDKTLFALLKTSAHHEDMASLSMQALVPNWNYDVVGSAKRIANRKEIKSAAEVPTELYPMLVTFRNIDDPASVERVDPDNLSASFGEGVKLKAITAEITDSPITLSIKETLPWLSTLRGTLKPDPPRYMDDPTDPDLRLLNVRSFSAEFPPSGMRSYLDRFRKQGYGVGVNLPGNVF